MVLPDCKLPPLAVRSFAGVGEFLVFFSDRDFLGEVWGAVCFSGDELFNEGSAMLLKDEHCDKEVRLCGSFRVSLFTRGDGAMCPLIFPSADSVTVAGGACTTAATDCCSGVCVLDNCFSPSEETTSELWAMVSETERHSPPIRFLGRRQSEFCPSRVIAVDVSRPLYSEVSIDTSEWSLSTSLETTGFCDSVFSTVPAGCCDCSGVIGLNKEELSSLGLSIVTLPLALLSPVRWAAWGCDGG